MVSRVEGQAGQARASRANMQAARAAWGHAARQRAQELLPTPGSAVADGAPGRGAGRPQGRPIACWRHPERSLAARPHLQAPKGKKVAAAPSAVKKAAAPAKPVNPLYEKRPKTFSACGEQQLQH